MTENIMAFESMQRFQHGTDWRWKLAQRGAAGGVSDVLLDADGLVKGAMDYIGLLAQGDGEGFLAAWRYPHLHAALGLWNNPLLQTRLKILVLGDCPLGEIAVRVGLDEETVETAEALFFDARGQLQACDWVLCAVIMKEERDGTTDLATHLRMAFFGGPLVAQSLLLHAKAQQALAVPLRDQKNVLKFLKMLLDCKCKTSELELACEKFRYRCQQELRRRQQADQPTETTTEDPITQAAMPKTA
jgi:hypothetical protein